LCAERERERERGKEEQVEFGPSLSWELALSGRARAWDWPPLGSSGKVGGLRLQYGGTLQFGPGAQSWSVAAGICLAFPLPFREPAH